MRLKLLPASFGFAVLLAAAAALGGPSSSGFSPGGSSIPPSGRRPAGFVTESDIRSRAVAAGRDPEEPVAAIMSTLLRRIHQGFIRSGMTTDSNNRFITAFPDAVLERLCRAVLADPGPPPGPSAFLLLGSEDPREQAPGTDPQNVLL